MTSLHRLVRSFRSLPSSSSYLSAQSIRFHQPCNLFCTAPAPTPVSPAPTPSTLPDPASPEYQAQAAALRSEMLVTRRRIRASPTLPLESVALSPSVNRVMDRLIAASGCRVRDLRVRSRRGETFRAPEVHSKILRTRKKLRGNVHVLSAPDYGRNQDALAYVAVRVPGTFAANVHVLTELRRLRKDFRPSTIIDLGAGAGTATAAAARVFQPTLLEEEEDDDGNGSSESADDAKNGPAPGLRAATLVEPSPEMRRLGEQILPAEPAVQNGGVTLNWTSAFVEEDTIPENEHVDLVISSYTLSEVVRNVMSANPDEPDDDATRPGRARRAENRLRALVRSLWARVADGGCLVLVEDGTAAGFETILFARDAILSLNTGTVVAPCLHSGKCPLASEGVTRHRLCRFAQRLNRPLAARLVKPMPDGFEDEHFSYVVLQKSSNTTTSQNNSIHDGWGRLMRNPLLRGKHVVLDACTGKGTLQRHVLTKKNSEPGMYHVARKAKWGDVWPVEPKSAPQTVHF